MEHHLEIKFNVSVNSSERDLVFHSEFRVSKFDV